MNQFPNLPKTPQQITNQYEQGLVNLGYHRKNLPPLWVYNLYEALKPNGKKLNDPSIPYFAATNHSIKHFAALIKSNNLVGPSGKLMTVLEYMEVTYDKQDKSNSTSQIPPLSPSIQALKNLPKLVVEPTSLEDKLADLKAAYLAQNPPSPKPASSPLPYHGPSR
jgi:hypothetical protein